MRTETRLMQAALIAHDFIVGPRDPNRNQAFIGKFMVAEKLEEGEGPVTQDASGGAWCVVGDDLEELIQQSYQSNVDGWEGFDMSHLKAYDVTFTPAGSIESQTFRCEADDAPHAQEQCENAEPGCTVVWVELAS